MAAIHELTDTWNDAGTVFDALHINVTDTASNAESMPLRASVGGVDKFTVRKDSRIRYGPDANNHWTHLVGATGDLGITGVAGGGGGNLTVTPPFARSIKMVLSGSGGFRVTTATNAALEVESTIGGPGMSLYDGSNVLKWGIVSRGVDSDTLYFSASPASITGPNMAAAAKVVFTQAGDVGIGTGTTASARLHAISLTEQFRSGYDASNYWNALTSSAGLTTFDAAGASAGFLFNKAIRLTQTVTTEALTADRSVTIVINGTTYKLLAKA